jgi:heat shock protein HslJ
VHYGAAPVDNGGNPCAGEGVGRAVKRAIVILLLAAALWACAGASNSNAAPLTGRTFLSTRVTDGGVDRPLAPGTQIRLSFRAADLSASAGCNIMSGTYRVADGILDTATGAMTAMGCDDARFKQDDWLAAFLGSKPTMQLSGNDLVLRSGEVSVTLVDRVIAEPDLDLVGPTWTLSSIRAGGTVSSVPGGASATMRFGADGRVFVQTGCNSGAGTYTAAGGKLQIGSLALTKRACIDGGATATETAIVALVNEGSLDYRIEASTLDLGAGDRGLQLHGES